MGPLGLAVQSAGSSALGSTSSGENRSDTLSTANYSEQRAFFRQSKPAVIIQPFLKKDFYFFFERERGREGERVGQKCLCAREHPTSVDCLWHAPSRDLALNQELNPNPQSHTSQGYYSTLNIKMIAMSSKNQNKIQNFKSRFFSKQDIKYSIFSSFLKKNMPLDVVEHLQTN